jgi:hypothetical protein
VVPQLTGDNTQAALLDRVARAGLHRLEETLRVQIEQAMMREHPKMARLALKTSVSKGWLLIAPAGSGAPDVDSRT